MRPIEMEIKILFEKLLSLGSSNSLDILRNLVCERLFLIEIKKQSRVFVNLDKS